ncbi:MAG: acetyl-CoA carboxylase biotin carboxyl carrier protein [Phycisphaerales bacterium]|nr:acetyl-CoA carboxylase biotin carboxyl carrier protein [Phycisphaerales bacterium]
MIDIRKLKELVKLMVENELSELDLRDQSETVTIKRGSDQEPIVYQAPAAAPAAAAAPAQAAAPAATTDADASADQSDAGLIPIESPMVGTYYAKPNPDSPAFINVGDAVSPDTVVCLIEAMKVFNEIKAEQSGTIAKMCVKDGDAVEFGQPLFMIKP